MRNRWVHIIAGLVFSGFALYFFARKIDPATLVSALHRFPWATIIIASVLVNLTFVFRAWRWQLLLHGYKPAKAGNLLLVSVVGYAANNVFPARAGELLRAVYLSQREKYPLTTALGSLIVERLFDSLGFFFLGAFPLLVFSDDLLSRTLSGSFPFVQHLSIRNLAIACTGMLGASLALLTFLLAFPNSTQRVCRTIASAAPRKWAAKIEGPLQNFFAVLGFVRNPWLVTRALFHTVAIVGLYTTAFWLLCGTFSDSFLWSNAAFTIALIALGVAVPSAPGYIGVMQLTIQKGLEFFALAPGAGEAIAIMYWAVGYIPTTIAGLIIYFADLARTKAQEPVPAVAEPAEALET